MFSPPATPRLADSTYYLSPSQVFQHDDPRGSTLLLGYAIPSRNLHLNH